MTEPAPTNVLVVLKHGQPALAAHALRLALAATTCTRTSAGAIAYNSLALPIAAGIFEPFGFTSVHSPGRSACRDRA